MPLAPIEIQTADSPRATVIILHGLGADGNDFVPIANELALDAVGPVRFIFPHAESRPVTINGGHVMPAWYDIFSFGGGAEDAPGLRASQAVIEGLIAREIARGIPASRIVLAGFSQGAAMTLMTGLRHAERLAGLGVLSGYLPIASTLAEERSAANLDVPIFMAHGRSDPVIHIDRATRSRDALNALDYNVEWHDYAMPHSVHPQEVVDWNRWLLKVLAPRPNGST